MTFEDSPFLKTIVERAPIAICILSADTLAIEFVNDRFIELTGQPREAILEKSYWDVFAEAKAHDETALADALQSGQTYYADERRLIQVRHGIAKELLVSFVYAPVPDEHSRITKVAVWALENTPSVTERETISEQNLNQIINMLPASVVVIRHEDLYVEMINDANLAYWKRSREEVVGKKFLDILPDLANQPFAGQLRRVMRTGEIIDVKESPVHFTMEDGTIRETYVDYTYQPLSDVHGNRNGVLVMSFEITASVLAKKQLENFTQQLSLANDQLSILNNRLAKSEARFRYFIHEAPVAIGILKGKDLIVESANTKILELWGKDEKIIGLALSQALPEIADQPFLEMLDQVFETGLPITANEILGVLQHPDGLKEIYFNLVYQPVKGLDGHVSDILIVAVDVSEQVRARKSIEESEAHFRRLADLVPAKISNFLPNGEVTFFNKQWLEFGGMILEDMRDFGYETMRHPDETEAFAQGLIAAAHKGAPHISEMRFKDLNGKWIWHLNISSPVIDDQGQITMWVGSATNIQAIKEEEQRKNDFIGMVSHEMKTPLTSLNGYLQILLRKAQKNEEPFLKQAYTQCLKQIRQMTTMINGFLDVSRLESGKLRIDKTEFCLESFLDELRQDYEFQYSSHQLQFEPAPKITINADREKISQVINNLVGNAVKYSAPDTPIRIKYRQADDVVRVSVSDQGRGIAAESLDCLFERYYRVEETMHISGFGIGLYVSSEIVKGHQGRIWAESEPGVGSTFNFELPIA